MSLCVVTIIKKSSKKNEIDSWKHPQKVDFSAIRPCAQPFKDWDPRESEKAECKAKAEEHEPYGWWPCIIQVVKDDV